MMSFFCVAREFGTLADQTGQESGCQKAEAAFWKGTPAAACDGVDHLVMREDDILAIIN